MLNQFKYRQNNLKLQSYLSNWYQNLLVLYKKYVPESIRKRRNIKQSKLDDVTVLTLMCWQVELKITVQSRYYQFLKNCIFEEGFLPERSRFNRICRNTAISLQLIRNGITSDYTSKPDYTVIDSLPLPLCKLLRNFKARALNKYADIGYNSTKKEHYYGFKGSFEIANDMITY